MGVCVHARARVCVCARARVSEGVVRREPMDQGHMMMD